MPDGRQEKVRAFQSGKSTEGPEARERCPPPVIIPNEKSQAEAAFLSTKIMERLRREKEGKKYDRDRVWQGKYFTMHDNCTYVVMVVKMRNGGRRTVIITSGTRQSLDPELERTVDKNYYVSVKPNPQGETGHHAEQRLFKWAEDNNVAIIEAISPTHRCCPDCTKAIQRRGDEMLDVVIMPKGIDKKTKDKDLQARIDEREKNKKGR